MKERAHRHTFVRHVVGHSSQANPSSAPFAAFSFAGGEPLAQNWVLTQLNCERDRVAMWQALQQCKKAPLR